MPSVTLHVDTTQAFTAPRNSTSVQMQVVLVTVWHAELGTTWTMQVNYKGVKSADFSLESDKNGTYATDWELA